MSDDDELLAARIPADVEMPDKVLANLTARQVLVLAATGLLAALAYLLGAGRLPLAVLVALVFPLVASGCSLALGRRDGVSLDRLLSFALQYVSRSKVLVAAPEGVEPPPEWCRIRGRLPEPLRLPVRVIRADGVMELADAGMAAIVRAGTISFGLRTAAEQAGLVAYFGRWLNSLDSPVQILVQARSADLSDLVDQVRADAAELPHPALEQAAYGHARFLEELSASRELLTREVLIVIRDQPLPGGSMRRAKVRQASASAVVRRADEAVRSLAGLGITAEMLDAASCTQVMADAFSPGEVRCEQFTGPDEPVSAAPIQSEEDPQ